MARNRDFEADDKIDPIKGSNRPTDFLRANFKILGPGGVFRTVKAMFSPKTIRAAAERAGLHVQIEDQAPWLKVTVTDRMPPKIAKEPGSYRGAGKMYPETRTTRGRKKALKTPAIISPGSHGTRSCESGTRGGFKNWRQFQKQPEIDIFS